MTLPSEDKPRDSSNAQAEAAGAGHGPVELLPARRPRRITRRALLLSAGGLLGAGGGLAAYARYVEPYWPAITRVDMAFASLPAALAGLRIVHLTDLHVIDETSAEYIGRQFRRLPDLRPDLIVVTGDFITSSAAGRLERLARVLPALRAPLGVYGVTGNHDCGVHNPAMAYGAAAVSRRVVRCATQAGVQMLRNACARIAVNGVTLQLVGVDDLWSGLHDADAAFADVDPDLPTILLAHNPDMIDTVRARPWHWMLCGHTHGGQVCVPFVGPPLLPVRHKEYASGLFDVGGRKLYVSRGLGYLRPVRFNCRPEITLFTLRSA